MDEIWLDIENYEGLYKVSNKGRVWANSRERKGRGKTKSCIRKLRKNLQGYLYVDLSKNDIQERFFVHRLVASAFIPNPENKPQVNHIDGNPSNNCVENLEWVTISENQVHRCYVLHADELKNVYQYEIDGTFVAKYVTAQKASDITGIGQPSICSCCAGKKKSAGGYRWSYNPNEKFEEYKNDWCVEVDVFDKYGNFVETIPSIRQAAKKYNTDEKNISACCRNARSYSVANNHIFKKKDSIDSSLIKDKSKKQIEKRTVRGILIKCYDSMIEASIDNDMLFTLILRCCEGKTKSCKGATYNYKIENDEKQ